MSTVLPVPQFVARDPAVITREMIAQYEAATGRVLQPAQVERLLIDVIAYRETLTRIAIQEAAAQNLVAFARFPMLDHLGELVGTPRLPARPAVVTVTLGLSAAHGTPVLVPAGTRVQTTDGVVVFGTDEAISIPPGASSATVTATATVAGELGNGYAPGTVTTLLDTVARIGSVTNADPTDGGADVEDDERYRERIRSAPERYSVAGSAEAYRFHAMSVSAAIADVAVTNPLMGVVRLYVLADTGVPSPALLSAVASAVSGDRVRPLSDTVEVVPPIEVQYEIEAVIRPLAASDPAAVLAGVQAAAAATVARLGSRLGRDIVPTQMIAAFGSVPGVYDVDLSMPNPQVLGAGEWARNIWISITLGEPVDG